MTDGEIAHLKSLFARTNDMGLMLLWCDDLGSWHQVLGISKIVDEPSECALIAPDGMEYAALYNTALDCFVVAQRLV